MSKTVDFLHDAKVFYLATVDGTEEAKRAMFKTLPALKEVYSYEELVLYYITDMQSIVYSFNAASVELGD